MTDTQKPTTETPKKEEQKKSKEEEEEDKDNDLTSQTIEKYRVAGDIVNQAIKFVIKQCAADKKIVDVCEAGDKFITDAIDKIYNNKKMEKGIGFPTCISVNSTVGHFSPLKEDTTKLKDGDVIKIDCGAHIDGYIAVAAHTFVLNKEATKVTTGKTADVLSACQFAADAAIKLLKPGGTNTSITEAIAKVATDFKVNPVQGVLSHQMKRFIIDADKVVINRTDADNKVTNVEFEPNEVYHIDVVMSTGDGKPKEIDERTTVYKRALETRYRLKLQASRQVLGEVDKRFPTFPFTLRAFEEKKARFGIKECESHDLVRPYPVLQEKDNDIVAHVKFTVLLTPSGALKVAGVPIDMTKVKSELKVTDESVKKTLGLALNKKKKSKAKLEKAAAKATGTQTATTTGTAASTTTSTAKTTTTATPVKPEEKKKS